MPQVQYVAVKEVERKPRGHGCLTLLLIIVGAIVVLAIIGSQLQPKTQSGTSGSGSAGAFTVTESGSMQRVQAVGDIVTFTTSIKNTSAGAIPHLVLWFNGIDPWTVDSQTSSCRADAPVSLPTLNLGSAWDYGQVPAGDTCSITMTLAATKAGNHTLTWDTYADVDSSSGAPQSQISGASYQWVGVINP